jgi:hypothetical protein
MNKNDIKSINTIFNNHFACPDWLITGLKFRSRHFKGIVTVLEIDISRNNLKVEMLFENSKQSIQDNWDLSITIWGFKNMEYQRI